MQPNKHDITRINNTLHYKVFYITLNKEVSSLEVNKEVLKGHIDTIILSLLYKKNTYGYEIAKSVREKSGSQFELKEGTLYLSLKRLEKSKWIESYWGDEQGPGGRRKYYKLTKLGIEGYKQKCLEWEFVKKVIDSFIEEGEK